MLEADPENRINCAEVWSAIDIIKEKQKVKETP
jgi:hypothetical protein